MEPRVGVGAGLMGRFQLMRGTLVAGREAGRDAGREEVSSFLLYLIMLLVKEGRMSGRGKARACTWSPYDRDADGVPGATMRRT